jgi:hypothetical protein
MSAALPNAQQALWCPTEHVPARPSQCSAYLFVSRVQKTVLRAVIRDAFPVRTAIIWHSIFLVSPALLTVPCVNPLFALSVLMDSVC